MSQYFTPATPRYRLAPGLPSYRFTETIVNARRDASGTLQVQVNGGSWVDAATSAPLVKSREEWVQDFGERDGIPCYTEYLKTLGAIE